MHLTSILRTARLLETVLVKSGVCAREEATYLLHKGKVAVNRK